MTEAQIPAYVDVRKVFDQEAEFSGPVGLDRLPRFSECLATTQCQVWANLQFCINDTGRRVILGDISANAEVTCQRCLEPVSIELGDEIKLAVLDSEEQLDSLEGQWEPWITEDPKIQLASLVEEQLMLCLPLVSYHPDPNCVEALGYKPPQSAAEAEDQEVGAENPFAVLKVLKQNDETV